MSLIFEKTAEDGEINNTSLSVTPTTEAQSFTPPEGYTGYNPVTVEAVTADIDSNIKAENIVSGVSILGVEGTAVKLSGITLDVTPDTVEHTYTPSGDSNAFTSVTMSAVTSSIDSNITAENIVKGVSILGVEGSRVVNKYGATINNLIGEVDSDGTLSAPAEEFTLDFSGVKTIGDSALRGAFANTNLTAVDVSSIQEIKNNGLYMAFNSTKITSLNFDNLETVGFGGCQSLTSNCYSLQGEVRFPKLASIDGQAFDWAFQGTYVTDLYFNALTSSSFISTTALRYICAGIKSSTVTLHFPGNLENTVETLTSYPLFGGTDGSVVLAYDLEATE